MPGFDEPERTPATLGAVTVLLTAAAGAINVVTYFAFNQVFASTMSGNLILIGLGLAQGQFFQILDNLSAILGYCAGLVVGTVFCGRLMQSYPWRNAIGATLTLELALLLAVGAYLHDNGGHGAGGPGGAGSANPILLVVTAGTAMGIQAAAARYIGPSGTPTSFLSGTVTNWVSSMVDRKNRFRWNWNSPLRILAMAGAAASNGLVQLYAPQWSFTVPVVLVLLAIVLMARVVRANHGGLFRGEPQLARDGTLPRETAIVTDTPAAPTASAPADSAPTASAPTAGPTGPSAPEHGPLAETGAPASSTSSGADSGAAGPGAASGVGSVRGRVMSAVGHGRSASLTLVDRNGQQVHRASTCGQGHFTLRPDRPGDFVLICTPDTAGPAGPARPHAELVTVHESDVDRDLVLDGSPRGLR